MSESNHLHNDAIKVLKETSRTFFIPISHLSLDLKDAVASAYLCMRAIDEIEDHPELKAEVKDQLLRFISILLESPQASFNNDALKAILKPYKVHLPEVTLRLGDWIKLCPAGAADKMMNATSIMAKGMAKWALKDWQIKTEEELDEYTYYVAGLVGVMLSDIWQWHDNIETDQNLAIGFGRGLQSVNILRNRSEDKTRGVNFFPEGWETEDMFNYARRNLAQADEYVKSIHHTEILNFCKIPLALAHGTLDVLVKGEEKLTRASVTEIVSDVVGE
ncbi:squalene/phytoene synthase family protein [Bacillus taeanensis]|uniref:Phytoene/squalene synthase family protein n=1 Tax=Bacillus taeanensis TaxID=273032 RepID=A0A366XTH7_9BACI|nr:phytoene/squalene synthase family protein [Bacillus taeanensis]RBW69452.1 phytoene/squalene synthase family protein [Bacillus taeanensis]